MASVGLLKAVEIGAFPPGPGQPRADTLSLKQRMADILSAEDGIAYWTAFVDFVQGKLDRGEFELAVHRALTTEELVSLHNALILSVLYNTTRAEPIPPTARSHAGWNKRKRRPDGSKVEDRDPKRRKVKEAALALGKRERGRLKSVAVAKELGRLGQGQILKSERPPNVLATPLGPKIRIASSTLAQDYAKGSQTPLCLESKQLPEVDGLKDRMSLIAYDYGIGGGADTAAASLMLIAIEVHLKSLLGDIFHLVRADRSSNASAGRSAEADLNATLLPTADPQVEGEAADASPAGLFAPAMEKRSSSSRTSRSDPDLHGVSNRFRDFKALGLAPPLQAQEFANLWDISPHAFVQAHPPALEWMAATRTPSEPSDDEMEDDPGRAGGADRTDKASAYSKGFLGKEDRLSKMGGGPSDSPTTPKIGNARLSDVAAAGKDGSTPPKGQTTPGGTAKNIHKLRVQLPPPPASSPSKDDAVTANGIDAAAAHKKARDVGTAKSASPATDLAAQLFPDDEDEAKPRRPAAHRKARQSEGAGSGSESDDAPLTATANGLASSKEKKKKHGWDRVDTFRLLEGV